MSKLIAAVAVLFTAAFSLSAHSAGDAEAGRDKAFTCMGCHAAPGMRNANPVYKVPKLAGQHADYIVIALKAYQSRERSHPGMQAQAIPMSDQDMEDIAAYFASIKN